MLIAALGNIGQKYVNTRHNFGFMLADALINYFRNKNYAISDISSSKFKSEGYAISLPNKKLFIIKPQTYMNLSGEAVQPFMAWHNISIDNLLVLHDELDIPFTDLRLKTGGGLAGHNGLKSIAERLSSKEFHRLRIGIGRPEDKEQMINHVLSQFSKEEQEKLQDIYIKGIEKIEIFLNKEANQKLK